MDRIDITRLSTAPPRLGAVNVPPPADGKVRPFPLRAP